MRRYASETLFKTGMTVEGSGEVRDGGVGSSEKRVKRWGQETSSVWSEDRLHTYGV